MSEFGSQIGQRVGENPAILIIRMTSRLVRGSRPLLNDIASARNQFHQLCGVSCLACSRSVFAGFGFSALRFIVAVITGLVFVLAFDLDVAPDICCGSADKGEAMADAPSGACSAILLDRINIIARALNQGRPSRLP
jgi:hypothetical protein